MAKKKVEAGSNEKMILAISFNVETNQYNIGGCQGTSVNEMAFGIMALAKTLVRDGHLTSTDEFIDKIKKYCDDPQYEEVKNDVI